MGLERSFFSGVFVGPAKRCSGKKKTKKKDGKIHSVPKGSKVQG